MRIIIEMRHKPALAEMSMAFMGGTEFASGPSATVEEIAPRIHGVDFDLSFAPVHMLARNGTNQAHSMYDQHFYSLSMAPEEGTYLLRATAENDAALANIQEHTDVLGVYSDPVIEPCVVCPGGPPLGTDADVEKLLCTAKMHAKSCGMDGAGVMVAIVDSGINLAHLRSVGKNPILSVANSWMPHPGLVPGQLPVDHGTMCAFDALIAAPRCTLLDIALLQSQAGGPTVMSGVLSDGVRAYRHLIQVMQNATRGGKHASMVVNNSWGMFHPSWDFPVGHPGNYSHNINHPFNRIVADLERHGADILFAAGNCGPTCPDGRCRGKTTDTIVGANSHPSVLTVGGVDVTHQLAGYSSIGPGALTRNKPDICGYTHFKGSGVYPSDGGTSAATPVVAGVVAAVRSKRPYNPANPSTTPSAIRSLLTSTANDLGAPGYDLKFGYGIVDGCELAQKLCRPLFIPPFPRPRIPDICRLAPELCKDGPIPLPNPGLPAPPPPLPSDTKELDRDRTDTGREMQLNLSDVELALIKGYLLGRGEL